MSIIKTVNTTAVNGSALFVYTFNVSFNELSEPALTSKLEDFFPSKIVYALPPVGGMIKNITQTPGVDGTTVTFEFGPVTPQTSFQFNVACCFGPGRVENDTFENTATLYANNTSIGTATAPAVTLTLNENFILYKKPVIYGSIAPGSEILFKLYLKNTGDLGASISNAVIQDILPTGLVPVTTFTPVGNDASTGLYTDSSQNGVTGSWTDSTMNFTLPSFKGETYMIEFKVTLDSNVAPGTVITNTATWTMNGAARNDALGKFKVSTPWPLYNCPSI